jgi:hypothetical protein
MKKPSKTKSNKTKEQYEQIGRVVDGLLQSEYLDRRQAYKASFIKGIVGGAGGVIGATVLIALLLWFLSVFKEIPLVGPVVDTIRNTVQRKQ